MIFLNTLFQFFRHQNDFTLYIINNKNIMKSKLTLHVNFYFFLSCKCDFMNKLKSHIKNSLNYVLKISYF